MSTNVEPLLTGEAQALHTAFVESGLPPHMLGPTLRYFIHHLQPGSFLSAVLCNDLCEAVARADEFNSRALVCWVGFLYNHAPAGSWGSRERFENWLANSGAKSPLMSGEA